MGRTSFQYMKNAYVCRECGHGMVTVDRDHGTTPFITDCCKCKAHAYSQFYRINQNAHATHEWFAPTDAELLVILTNYSNPHQRAGIREHVKRGGLLLREISYGQEKREPQTGTDQKSD